MEIGTLIIGIVIGLVIGGTLGFVALKAMQSNSVEKASHSEAELKALLAIQARQHLDVSRKALADIQGRTADLVSQLNDYEESLTEATASGDETTSTFFGEHASLFLRNSLETSKHDIALAQPDAQPRDFANTGSGVFVGVDTKASKENKSQS
jgi:uncharacterized membrane-anchored protein YhcB (DUF1043 family)